MPIVRKELCPNRTGTLCYVCTSLDRICSSASRVQQVAASQLADCFITVYQPPPPPTSQLPQLLPLFGLCAAFCSCCVRKCSGPSQEPIVAIRIARATNTRFFPEISVTRKMTSRAIKIIKKPVKFCYNYYHLIDNTKYHEILKFKSKLWK